MKRIIFRSALFISMLAGPGCGPLHSTITLKIVRPDNFDPSSYVDSKSPEGKNSDEYIIPDTREAIFSAMKNVRCPKGARIHGKGGRDIKMAMYVPILFNLGP